ncbi:MAG: flagellar export protein FliJ [Defluviitaleaceae bacterium]|nr:flagellar export protein FliJ [Defluviitaleaceae bacterium]
MAKFKFELQPILGFKEQVENQKELEFAKTLNIVAKEREKLEGLFAEKDSSLKKFKGEVCPVGGSKLLPTEFIRLNNYIEHLKKCIERQKDVLMKAELILEQKRLALIEASKERKTLDKLKENKFEEHLFEEKQSEQKIIDEVVSYKHSIKEVS